MGVDLSDSDTLIASLIREVNTPGQQLFNTATDDDWAGNLEDAFWEAKLYGFFAGYTEANLIITPINAGDPDLGRDFQELIVLFAGARIIRNELKNTNTKFHVEAGSAVFDTENSANLLIACLKDIRSKVDLAMAAIGTINSTTVAYVDSLIGREQSLAEGTTFVARGGSMPRGGVGPYGYGGGWDYSGW